MRGAHAAYSFQVVHTPHPYRELPYLRGAAPCGLPECWRVSLALYVDCSRDKSRLISIVYRSAGAVPLR